MQVNICLLGPHWPYLWALKEVHVLHVHAHYSSISNVNSYRQNETLCQPYLLKHHQIEMILK